MKKTIRLVILVLLALAGTMFAVRGGGWLVHKFRAMHGIEVRRGRSRPQRFSASAGRLHGSEKRGSFRSSSSVSEFRKASRSARWPGLSVNPRI